MIEYMFKPLDQQPDDGLCSLGLSFQDAAEHLVEHSIENGARNIHGHLPINYLYRHAIELYLKSMILVAHRYVTFQAAGKSDLKPPKVEVSGKPKTIFAVHGIQDLFTGMRKYFDDNQAIISQKAKTDWCDVPEELVGYVSRIDDTDPASMVFRYPNSRSASSDIEKQSFKAVPPDQLEGKLADKTKLGQFVMAIVDENDAIVDSYVLDREVMSELRVALQGAVKLLSGASFGIIAELGIRK